MASTVITRTVSLSPWHSLQFPLSLTLTHGPVGIASILGVSFQHHRVKVQDKVPNFFVTQKPNWGARVTLLPVHRYYRIAAQLPLLTAYLQKSAGEFRSQCARRPHYYLKRSPDYLRPHWATPTGSTPCTSGARPRSFQLYNHQVRCIAANLLTSTCHIGSLRFTYSTRWNPRQTL